MEEGSGAGKRPRAAELPTQPNHEAEADDAGGGDERDRDMDKFYALLGSIRAMRDLLWTNKRRKVDPAPLWRPTFKLEDFQSEKAEEPAGPADAESALIDPSPSSGDRKGKKKEEGGDTSVDLSLSL